MKKVKNQLIAILLLFLLSSSSFILYNNVENSASNSLIQDINSPKLSNPGKSLLHSYDFEDETIGQDPTYDSLTIDESSGDVYIDDLSDGQKKYLALHKVGTSGRVWVRDNFSRFGETYTAGEYHLKVYHDASGFGINLNSANGEYILAMVWDDGEITNGVGGNLLATYTYDQWLDVVIYFNLSLGWMFDLEGVRYGVGYSLSFFGPFTANAEHIWITSFVSGGGDGWFRVDDLTFYYETENSINIFSPESKEYKKPMDGYYPGTYGFENDKYGEQAQGWWTENEANCDSQIIETYKGHNNVYELYDNSGSAKADVINNFENKTYGTIELWFQLGTSNYHAGIVVGFREPYKSKISFQISPGSNLLARNGTVLNAMPEFGIMKADSWYHLRFDFRAEGAPYYMGLSEDSYMVYLNGTKANSELSCNPIESGFPFNSLQFSTGGGFSPDYLIYFDAIGYSWDPNYQVGDNLYEGLLLSYKNSTSLDWQGYSLDGQANKTILGNTTVPMPDDGIHSIQVFGNDSLGDMYQSDLRHFTVDFPIDIITPEAKIYERGMSGYYPGTYGFENVKDGALPTDWMFNWDGTSYVEVDDTKDGHHKVLEVRKIDDGAQYSGGTKIFENNATAGTVEFWLYKDTNGATDATKIDVKGEGGNVRLIIENQDLFRGDYGSRVLLALDVFMINTWYHIRIDFNVSQGGWQVQLDDTWYGSGYTIPFTGVPTEFWGFGIGSHWSGCNNNYGAWLDALSNSWDPNYNIGDNLNEGLLLSYENSTNLDWQGYSLDGQPTNTIMGNTTIPLPEDGSHFIRVFGNDSLGTIYQSTIRRFSVYHINIITPEEKTYTDPMNGYYPGTYGFENDDNGVFPFEWIDESFGTAVVTIEEEKSGHQKVIKSYDPAGSSRAQANQSFSPKSSGSVEFWFLKEAGGTGSPVQIVLQGNNLSAVHLLIDDSNFGNIFHALNYGEFAFGKYSDDQWFHIKIDFNCLTDKYDLYLDGVKEIDQGDFQFNQNWIKSFYISSSNSRTGTYYIDAIGYSWDPNYNIGDNRYEGLLLSYESSTALDWQGYSLDGQPINTIMGNITIPLPDVGQHTVQVFANDSLGLNYYSDIRHFTIRTPIQIITPENKTYTEPMSGYYPATFGFEDVLDDTTPSYVEYKAIGTSPDWVTSYTEVINNKVDGAGNNHNKVLLLKDGSSSSVCISYFNFTDYGSEIARNSTLEFYHCLNPTGTHYLSRITLTGNSGTLLQIIFDTNALELEYFNSTGQHATGLYIERDRWYRYSIDISCDGGYAGLSANQFRFRIYDYNGDLFYTSYDMDFQDSHPTGGPNRINMVSSETQTQVYEYLDAFSITGLQDNYTIGDNLDEGLLLSFEHSTALDWMGYSLDGQTNITILGNTTIPLSDDGQHSIQIFGKDSLGTNYQSDIRYFSVNTTQSTDLINPIITINFPGLNDLFGSGAPSYDITVIELNLNTMWYTLDWGLINTSITEPTGTIDQTLWNNRPNGTVDIRFYADDIAGNVGFEEVTVRKDILPPQITINSPSPNQIFYEEAPSFDLTIVEQNLDAIWYTLDDGIVTFLCGTSGNVNNLYWNAIPPGFYILKFYTNDTVGNIGFSEVTIKKEDPAIPGYNPFVLSLILLVGILGISLKIKKKAR